MYDMGQKKRKTMVKNTLNIDFVYRHNKTSTFNFGIELEGTCIKESGKNVIKQDHKYMFRTLKSDKVSFTLCCT